MMPKEIYRRFAYLGPTEANIINETRMQLTCLGISHSRLWTCLSLRHVVQEL